MLRFTYSGRTQGGEKTQGFLEADSATDCANILLRSGITPITVRETGQSERRNAGGFGFSLFAPRVMPIFLASSLGTSGSLSKSWRATTHSATLMSNAASLRSKLCETWFETNRSQ